MMWDLLFCKLSIFSYLGYFRHLKAQIPHFRCHPKHQKCYLGYFEHVLVAMWEKTVKSGIFLVQFFTFAIFGYFWYFLPFFTIFKYFSKRRGIHFMIYGYTGILHEIMMLRISGKYLKRPHISFSIFLLLFSFFNTFFWPSKSPPCNHRARSVVKMTILGLFWAILGYFRVF